MRTFLLALLLAALLPLVWRRLRRTASTQVHRINQP